MQNKKKGKAIKKDKKNKHSSKPKKFSKNCNPSPTQNPPPNAPMKPNSRRRSPPTPTKSPKPSTRTSKKPWWREQSTPRNSSNSWNDHPPLDRLTSSIDRYRESEINWRSPWEKFCWASPIPASSSCAAPYSKTRFWARSSSSPQTTTSSQGYLKFFSISAVKATAWSPHSSRPENSVSPSAPGLYLYLRSFRCCREFWWWDWLFFKRRATSRSRCYQACFILFSWDSKKPQCFDSRPSASFWD